ncbi:MAG: hypothetical protein GWP91_16690 [Rhodobacterales bacterium]|nr:hypothetical protein [Rhodobacterales bacterium]
MRAAILVVLTSTTWLTACDDRGGIAIEDDSTTHVARPPPALVINEVVAANATGLTDEVGAHPDWIELYNPTSEEVSLAGWRLVNDLDQAGTLHPSLTLPAGETLVFFADNDPEEGPNHLQLRLDVNGEWLGLVYLDEVVDSVEWGPLIPDVALARSPDGYPDWVISTAPTPDALNGGTQVPENPATLDCLPSVTLGEPFIVEGQATTASASCPADSFDTGWVTPGGDLNGNEWSWTPDVDQAGEHAVLFWAKQTGTTGVPETATANIGVADAWSNPANITVDPETYSREWGLPVLHLAPSAPPSQNYQPAPAWFDGVQYQGQMKIRGAASAGYPKNNYTLEFDPIQIDLGSVGLQNKDHLVLISNFDDNSYTRQALVYAVWDRMATNFG